MATDLLNLPGYPGHDQVHAFADECARGMSDDTRAGAQALQAELSRRVALLSESQIAPLADLLPQTRKLWLRVLLNRVSADEFNAWSAGERVEQLRDHRVVSACRSQSMIMNFWTL